MLDAHTYETGDNHVFRNTRHAREKRAGRRHLDARKPRTELAIARALACALERALSMVRVAWVIVKTLRDSISEFSGCFPNGESIKWCPSFNITRRINLKDMPVSRDANRNALLFVTLVAAFQSVCATTAVAAYKEEWISSTSIAREAAATHARTRHVSRAVATPKPASKTLTPSDDPITAFVRPQVPAHR